VATRGARAFAIVTNILCGNYSAANDAIEELSVLAQEKDAPFRKAQAVFRRGCVLALTGQAQSAVEIITSGTNFWRLTGATIFTPEHLFMVAAAYADVGQFEDAWRCIGEAITAMEESQEKWCEAEVHRVAGEVVLKQPQRDVVKAQAYFEHALAVARAQQPKSWELRAAMSMARLWRDQDNRQQACDLLAQIYGWFTEGFDTRDLKEAKALLGTLAS
jgi:predicted ATPase